MAKVILTVEDSRSMRQMVSYSLNEAGYEVVEAVDGEDGLDKLLTKKFDLILTDHNMPKMDGIAMIKEVRSMPEYQSVPILVLTTESGEDMKAQGKAAGATGWVVKPFEPEKLLMIINKVIG